MSNLAEKVTKIRHFLSCLKEAQSKHDEKNVVKWHTNIDETLHALVDDEGLRPEAH